MTARAQEHMTRWLPALVTFAVNVGGLCFFLGRTETHMSNADIHTSLGQEFQVFATRDSVDRDIKEIKETLIRIDNKLDERATDVVSAK